MNNLKLLKICNDSFYKITYKIGNIPISIEFNKVLIQFPDKTDIICDVEWFDDDVKYDDMSNTYVTSRRLCRIKLVFHSYIFSIIAIPENVKKLKIYPILS